MGVNMKPLYILKEGILRRSGNTLYFINKEGKKPLPINNVSDIYCFGKVTLRSGAISLLLKKNVPTHFFNMYGFYEGSLTPREKLVSGLVVVKQSECYLDKKKRVGIAKEMIYGIKHNVLKTLKYYRKKEKEVGVYIDAIEKITLEGRSIQIAMGNESTIWSLYYKSFNEIIKNFKFEKRERRPPTDEINALISFGNSLLYTTTLSEIYKTYLHPAISFLHEPLERRYSLALDFADIFKPIIVERIIFQVINNRMIDEGDFDKDVGIYLNDKGKRKFLKAYDEKLSTTIKHKTLKRKVSYRYLIRLEGYKLIKHILGDKKYESFKMWW